jgi:hypothetical protein
MPGWTGPAVTGKHWNLSHVPGLVMLYKALVGIKSPIKRIKFSVFVTDD